MNIFKRLCISSHDTVDKKASSRQYGELWITSQEEEERGCFLIDTFLSSEKITNMLISVVPWPENCCSISF